MYVGSYCICIMYVEYPSTIIQKKSGLLGALISYFIEFIKSWNMYITFLIEYKFFTFTKNELVGL